jgi:hypothetical protein
MALIIATVFGPELVPAMAISLVVGFVVSHRYSLPYTRKLAPKSVVTG